MAERAGVGFLQPEPALGNMYSGDAALRSTLSAYFSGWDRGAAVASGTDSSWSAVDRLLVSYGDRLAAEAYPRLDEMERNKPRLVQFSAFGRRLSRLDTCWEWREMHRHSAANGLIATAYTERKQYGRGARLLQFAKLHLFSPNSGMYSCPLAMTDGAAKLMEIVKDDPRQAELLRATSKAVYDRLTSVDPDKFWTSGQWMTERGGGSDVSDGTRTVAVPIGGGYHALSGFKWFSSATDADVAVALARDRLQNGTRSKRLSCFMVKLPKGPVNDCSDAALRGLRAGDDSIQIARLKNKLGTRQLPTAELELKEAKAIRISPPGRGVRFVANLVNITRLHNCVAATGLMAKATMLAQDYSRKRKVFGKKLCELPLHLETLASLRCLYSACLHITFRCASLQGIVEAGADHGGPHAAHLLRILTPVAKMYTAKCGVYVLTETMECIGGVGYMEDSGFPRMVRDGMVLPIWEGTTNVLAMDVIRVIQKTPDTLTHLTDDLRSMIRYRSSETPSWAMRSALCECLLKKISQIDSMAKLLTVSKKALRWSRDFALLIAKTFCGAALLKQAEWSGEQLHRYIAEMYVLRNPQDNGTAGLQATDVMTKITEGINNQSLMRALALGENVATTLPSTRLASKL